MFAKRSIMAKNSVNEKHLPKLFVKYLIVLEKARAGIHEESKFLFIHGMIGISHYRDNAIFNSYLSVL